MAFTWVKYTRLLVSMLSFTALSLAVFAIITPHWIESKGQVSGRSSNEDDTRRIKLGLWKTCNGKYCFDLKQTKSPFHISDETMKAVKGTTIIGAAMFLLASALATFGKFKISSILALLASGCTAVGVVCFTVSSYHRINNASAEFKYAWSYILCCGSVGTGLAASAIAFVSRSTDIVEVKDPKQEQIEMNDPEKS